jgi:hypothetical protein
VQPLLIRIIFNAALSPDPGIVDQDVQTSQLCRSLANRAPDGLIVGDVCLDVRDSRMQILQDGRRFFSAVEDHDIGSLLSEQIRGCLPDAGCSTRYEHTKACNARMGLMLI